MESLNTEQEALAFLKTKRSEEPVEPPEESEVSDEALDEIEASEVEIEESDEAAEIEDDAEELVYLINDEEVTLEQILEWKKGNLRESDYTKKTQGLAEQRKAYEAKESKLAAKESKVDELIGDLEQNIFDQEQAIDWDVLAEEDPSEFLKQEKKIERKKASLEKAKAEKQKAIAERNKLYIAEQQALLGQLMPQWSNQETMNSDLKGIGALLSRFGYSDAEMGKIHDARLWPVFSLAAQQLQLAEKKPQMKKRVKQAPKVLKPTKARSKPSDTSAKDEAKKRLAATGSDRDALAYLKARRGA